MMGHTLQFTTSLPRADIANQLQCSFLLSLNATSESL